ncbi:MAG TPA: riboflavin synthase [Cyclobacteriaceae bacterium]|nr:riboflavin synthase [Cytophagales bacterium]HMR57901.1 riboflavin synthase [Cyclobacteriaceae bacterium]HNT50722.1 riboflavin synthase [Cyclobacteriaceae bacterium]HRE67001.1 riboflavin synthase [Cyclobacteriaceae bacterium]HRF33175.1 riboflavin synthase [Cyclobacteriaceae bacterium]
MFTGIIETVGKVKQIEPENSNVTFCIESEISNQLKVDQSVSHDGVCLTVIKVTGNMHWVTAINETLEKSNLRSWKAGTLVNLERCMVANGRFDGHIVQGHVDQIGIIKSVTDERGSWMFEVEYNANLGNVTIEKGSVAVNGVSLTCFNSREGSFTVAIIPYTFEHTGFGKLKTGDSVNLEFDVIGKYVKRLLKH